jgi:ATP-dependent helicase/nuclease subunit A
LSKPFTIYRSSAGSGKTRTLAKEYLTLALAHRASYFRHILAVTFTNKSTQEMKDRILLYLNKFSKGEFDSLAHELMQELKLDSTTFQMRCQDLQRVILHHYSQFSISTIDAFFQRVIRSFTRESGLMGDYRLEVDIDLVLEEVVDSLMDELGINMELSDWVIDFTKENLENDKSWDIRTNLKEFAYQIFTEEFKVIEDDLLKSTEHPEFFKGLRKKLQNEKYAFINFVSGKAQQALLVIQEHQLEVSDFKYNGGPGYSFFKKLEKISKVVEFKEPGVTITRDLQDIKNWPKSKSPKSSIIMAIAETTLLPLLSEILDYRERYYQRALSAEAVLEKFYSFGLVADISRKLNEYRFQNNVMLLADAPKFLNKVIDDSDTPFIYEKVGTVYRNYLIDEFQDTSGYQWKNFLPLLTNSLDQGYRNVVVGDVKQAIYRWRGGNLELLQQKVEQQIGKERVGIQELDKNFRSAPCIVDFNNLFFKKAALIISEKIETELPLDVFKDVNQTPFKDNEGFVQIDFVEEQTKEDKWKEIALNKIPEQLEFLQQAGISLKDIAILVRKNDEGQKIAAHLLAYKYSDRTKSNCKYDVISSESLQIDRTATVNLLLSAMRYLLNADNAIARAQLSYEYARLKYPERELRDVFTVSNQVFFENNLPEAFSKLKSSLKKLPLFELTETLIQIFELGEEKGELAYLQAFQDIVLEFYSRERNDLGAFLEWWEENGYKRSVQVSGEIDAAQIVTIHKSKGLQFKYVIIPFCSWNMDHDNLRAPMLWVNAPQDYFADAAFLPVQYSSKLKDSFFAEFYNTEKVRCYLDNLNLLYVAFTRAEAGLLITLPYEERNRNSFSVAKLIKETIFGSTELNQYWNQAELQWKKGVVSTVNSKAESKESTLSLSVYPVWRWRDRLVIKKSFVGFVNPEDEEIQQQKVRYGIQMHAVLSRIRYADEIPSALEAVIHDGTITTQEKEPLHQQLQELLAQPEIENWFSRQWKVRTEAPIILPDGGQSRIDRLLMRNKRAIVIDFKTGERHKKDIQQVKEYIATLHQMNFTEVDGYLLYLRDGEIVNVKEERLQRIRKVNDDNQLGLF